MFCLETLAHARINSMNKLLKVSLWLLAFVPLVALNPYIYTPGQQVLAENVLFPFITGKNILIRFALSLFWVIFSVTLLRKANQLTQRLLTNRFYANPVFIALSAVLVSGLISALFGVNPFRSFFGDLERGMGYFMTLTLYLFLVGSLIVFDRKDWFTMLKYMLVAAGILAIDGFIEAFTGIARVQSFLGNPLFLAAYFLFSIFASGLVLEASRHEPSVIGPRIRFWRWFAFAILTASVIGLFLTGTRSAILGLIVGLGVCLLYLAWKGKGLHIKSLNLQKASLVLIVAGIALVGIFFATKQSAFWQSVPGVNRFASATLSDRTFKTRLIAGGVAIESVKPSNEGLLRTLVGWGPDNFLIAYNAHYNPEYLRYENLWFDRTHNQALDYLAMQGIVGLLAYLALQLSLLIAIIRKIENPIYALAALFFLTAYFVHTMFTFDEISTNVAVMVFVGLVIMLAYAGNEAKESVRRVQWWKIAAPITGLGLTFLFVVYGLIPLYQNMTFVGALQSGSGKKVLAELESFTAPYNHAQREIRYQALKAFMPIVGAEGFEQLLTPVVEKVEQYVEREPIDPRRYLLLGTYYSLLGEKRDPKYFEVAQENYERALALSPKRQEILYSLAVNYADMKQYDKLEEYLNKMLELGADIPRAQLYYSTGITMAGVAKYDLALTELERLFEGEGMALGEDEIQVLRNVYNNFLNQYYKTRNSDKFLRSMKLAAIIERIYEAGLQSQYERGLLIELPFKQSERLDLGIEAFGERGWAAINFEQ